MEATSAAPDRLVRLGVAFRKSKTLLSAVELGVFTLLAQQPLELFPLAEKSGVHTRGARDFFDALVALGLLERDESGRYSNAPDANLYLDRNKLSYIGGELELANARQFGPWSMLTDALRTGEPQSGARGTENYRAYYADPAILENVARGMTGGSLRAAQAIAPVSRGAAVPPTDISARRECFRSRLRRLIHTSPAAVSIFPRSSRCSKPMPSNMAWRAACASIPEISSPIHCPQPTFW